MALNSGGNVSEPTDAIEEKRPGQECERKRDEHRVSGMSKENGLAFHAVAPGRPRKVSIPLTAVLSCWQLRDASLSRSVGGHACQRQCAEREAEVAQREIPILAWSRDWRRCRRAMRRQRSRPIWVSQRPEVPPQSGHSRPPSGRRWRWPTSVTSSSACADGSRRSFVTGNGDTCPRKVEGSWRWQDSNNCWRTTGNPISGAVRPSPWRPNTPLRSFR
jgi:hypothetical protein